MMYVMYEHTVAVCYIMGMHTYPYILFFNDSEIKLIQHTFAHTCSSESVCAHARKPALLLNVLSP